MSKIIVKVPWEVVWHVQQLEDKMTKRIEELEKRIDYLEHKDDVGIGGDRLDGG
jgi:hypothetical protein